MFLDIILSYVLQMAFTVGLIYLFGTLIALCNKGFYRNFGSSATSVCRVTGFLGTPVHELSHALFCVIFAHKIIEIKLFQSDSSDGTLGYVKHSFKPKNVYQRIGNFFIGTGPIIVISSLLFLAAYLLLPEFTAASTNLVTGVTFGNASGFFSGVFGLVKTFFSLAVTWQWWVFVLLGAFFSLHMTLSKPDIKDSVDGLIFILAAFLIVDVIMGLVNGRALAVFTNGVISVGSRLLCIFIISLALALFSVLVSFILRKLLRLR